MIELPRLFVEFATLDQLLDQIESNLRRGRAFVPGPHELSPLDACELVLVHPVSGAWLSLLVEAVYIAGDAAPGVGLEIKEPLDRLSACLEDFVGHQGVSLQGESGDEEPELRADDAPSSQAGLPEDRQCKPAVSVAQKVRGLSAAGRERVAKRGTLAERIALERAFGPASWEVLLSNPLLSTAEVAKIAKNHAASQPILSMIVMNAAWLVKPEVRRALLSNPRLTEPQVERTLRALPATELKLVLRQVAYPVRVRNLAKRLLGV